MFTNQFFEILLNLDDNWQVSDVSANHKKEDVIIKIKYIGKQAECPKTMEQLSIYDHSPERVWRHLDTMQFKTYISCSLPRVKNSKGKVITTIPPWASKHERHTYLFERATIDLIKATKNQTKTSEIMRCSFNVVNRIMHISTERGMERRGLSELEFEHLSIDEKSFKKGHKYISVLSHPRSGCVIDVEEDRTKEAVRKLLDKSLTKEQQLKVETISMDMWKAYMTACKEKLPNAERVHDRFHLVKYLNDAIDKVRRREVKTNEELIDSRWALLKNEINLTEKQHIKFEAIKNANYEVSKAWQVKENFKDLFNKEDNKESAFKLFMRWIKSAKDFNIKEITKVAEMFKKHFWGVINALITTFNNAMAERLNGKIQEIKTVGRGYRTFTNFRSAILFFHGGLNLYPLN
jgi:transposase